MIIVTLNDVLQHSKLNLTKGRREQRQHTSIGSSKAGKYSRVSPSSSRSCLATDQLPSRRESLRRYLQTVSVRCFIILQLLRKFGEVMNFKHCFYIGRERNQYRNMLCIGDMIIKQVT